MLDNFSGELGSTKESIWDALASLRARLDNLEALVEQSNSEIVGVLNKKAYKDDVMRALVSKADKESTLNSIRMKADAVSISSALSAKADLLETRDLINRNQTAIASNSRDLADLREDFRIEKSSTADKIKRKVDVDEVEGLKLACAGGSDWRMALTDLGVNVRREIADKANREEIVQMVHREADDLKDSVNKLQEAVSLKANMESASQLIADVDSLERRFAEANAAARWLWRSGKVVKGGLIPWEVQVKNAVPQSLLWKAGSESITCITPGLYHLKLGVFTQNPAAIQLCVSGEPIISLQPTDDGFGGGGGVARFKEESGLEHIKKRNRCVFNLPFLFRLSERST